MNKILAIETSCDETAVSIIDGITHGHEHKIRILGNALYSQAHIHAKYGGVYPNLAKREHAHNIVPILTEALREADVHKTGTTNISNDIQNEIGEILRHEATCADEIVKFLSKIAPPDIDAIAVTHGPGLEPALWVGVNVAKVLSIVWNKPMIAVNHMEGHIFASLLTEELIIIKPHFPVLAFLISGGHTDLILMKDWFLYDSVGTTKDDAMGEAFDKVARMLELPYPGGPEISRLAKQAKKEGIEVRHRLPRPMLKSGNCDFSFSGLKTAVLYALKKVEISERIKKEFAREFEEAVVDISVEKVRQALLQTDAKGLVVGGGVSANSAIRNSLKTLLLKEFPNTSIYLPDPKLSTDNAIMISIAGYLRAQNGNFVSDLNNLGASGNLKLAV